MNFKHDILAAGRCRVPTDLNLETHIKIVKNVQRLEFGERRVFRDGEFLIVEALAGVANLQIEPNLEILKD